MTDSDLKSELAAFRFEIDKWSGSSLEEKDEIYSESVSRFWQYQSCATAAVIQNLFGWLLLTARLVRLEGRRKTQLEREVIHLGVGPACPTRHHETTRRLNPRRARAFNTSVAWSNLPAGRQRLLIRVIAEGVKVAVAAREIGVNINTAKSWINRDKQRLRQDETLQRLAGAGATSRQRAYRAPKR